MGLWSGTPCVKKLSTLKNVMYPGLGSKFQNADGNFYDWAKYLNINGKKAIDNAITNGHKRF